VESIEHKERLFQEDNGRAQVLTLRMGVVNNSEAINLGITIGLGILSLGLGMFAIWLASKYENKSSSALDAIKALASETRILIDASLSQQKDFSGKMLDSILSRNQYGGSQETSEEIDVQASIREALVESEFRIANKVEEQVRALADRTGDQSALTAGLASIRNDIASLAEKAAQTASETVSLPLPLRDELVQGRMFPARILLLAAISRDDLHSVAAVDEVAEKYALPAGREVPIHGWIESGILEGSPKKFDVKKELRRPLALWVDRNRSILNAITMAMRKPTSTEEGETSLTRRSHARQLARTLEF
jgi:hypothetical protein